VSTLRILIIFAPAMSVVRSMQGPFVFVPLARRKTDKPGNKTKIYIVKGKERMLNIIIVEHNTIEIIIKPIDFLTKRYSFLPHNLSM
jgi:hypothetical protein